MSGVSKVTGGGTNFPRPIKPQEVHSVEPGAAKKPHHIPSTQLPAKEAGEAHLAGKIAQDGVGRLIDLEA